MSALAERVSVFCKVSTITIAKVLLCPRGHTKGTPESCSSRGFFFGLFVGLHVPAYHEALEEVSLLVVIHFASVTYSKSQYDKLIILYLTNKPVVSDTVTPLT